MQLSILVGTNADLAAAAAFHDRLYHHPFPFARPEGRYCLSPIDHLLLAFAGDALVGYLAGTVDEDIACVLGIATDGSMRRQGIGTRLLHDFARIASDVRSPLISLQAEPVPTMPSSDLIAFYLECGFAEHRDDSPTGVAHEHVLMRATPHAVIAATM